MTTTHHSWWAQEASSAYLGVVEREYEAAEPEITLVWVREWLKARAEACGDQAEAQLIWSCIFIDDNLGQGLDIEVAKNWRPVWELQKGALRKAEEWGLPIGPTKIVLPCIDPVFLGILNDNDKEIQMMTAERKERWAEEAESMAHATMIPKSKMKSFLHKMVWSAQYAIPELMPWVAPLFYTTKYNYPSRKGMVQNTEAIRTNMRMIARLMLESNGITQMPSMLFPEDEDGTCCVTYTDASGTGTLGMGGHSLPFYYMAKFTAQEAELSVPVKEHLAVELWAATLQRKLNPRFMKQYSDALDVVIVQEKNKSGNHKLARIQAHGARRDSKTGLVRKLEHRYRRHNQPADDLSKLDEELFKQTCRLNGYKGTFIRVQIPKDIRDTRWLTEAADLQKVKLLGMEPPVTQEGTTTPGVSAQGTDQDLALEQKA